MGRIFAKIGGGHAAALLRDLVNPLEIANMCGVVMRNLGNQLARQFRAITRMRDAVKHPSAFGGTVQEAGVT